MINQDMMSLQQALSVLNGQETDKGGLDMDEAKALLHTLLNTNPYGVIGSQYEGSGYHGKFSHGVIIAVSVK